MPSTRTTLDDEHPCLACGAAWRVTEQAIDTPDLRPPVLWVAISEGCSARCYPLGDTSAEAYTQAEQERTRRRWA